MPPLDLLIRECKRQEESCQYTSAALYSWLAAAKWQNRAWNSLPIICGALASFAALKQSNPFVASFLAMLAGLLPAIYEKLGLQAYTDEILTQAGQYKNLENRFRQAAEIVAAEGAEAIKAELASLMRQIEDLRARPIIIPERHFLTGRDKIKAGHYEPDKSTVAAASRLAKKAQDQQ
jgi:hypothetical protein